MRSQCRRIERTYLMLHTAQFNDIFIFSLSALHSEQKKSLPNEAQRAERKRQIANTLSFE